MDPPLGHEEEPELIVAGSGEQGKERAHAERCDHEDTQGGERGLVVRCDLVIRWHGFDYRRLCA